MKLEYFIRRQNVMGGTEGGTIYNRGYVCTKAFSPENATYNCHVNGSRKSITLIVYT